MSMHKFIFVASVLLLLCVSTVACNGEGAENKYTDEELNEMSAMVLYDVFLENGLEVDEDLLKNLTKDQLSDFFKSEFDLLVQGVSSRSHSGYMKLAEDTKVIYEKIRKK